MLDKFQQQQAQVADYYDHKIAKAHEKLRFQSEYFDKNID